MALSILPAIGMRLLFSSTTRTGTFLGAISVCFGWNGLGGYGGLVVRMCFSLSFVVVVREMDRASHIVRDQQGIGCHEVSLSEKYCAACTPRSQRGCCTLLHRCQLRHCARDVIASFVHATSTLRGISMPLQHSWLDHLSICQTGCQPRQCFARSDHVPVVEPDESEISIAHPPDCSSEVFRTNAPPSAIPTETVRDPPRACERKSIET